jgi:outer membrane immunogenic protein
MNKFLGGACVLVLALCTGVTAYAGDFKGFYVGFNVGGNSGHSNAATSTVFSPTGYFATSSVPAIATVGKQNISGNSFVGGGQAGFNLQHNAFVLGLEADFGGMNLGMSKTGTATYPCCAPTAFTIKQFVGTSWLFTLRPRVGFTGGPVFVYGTGGLAMTNVEYTAVFTDTFATASESSRKTSTQAGWSAGGGAEIKLGHRWSVKGEYLRADFGDLSNTSTNLTAFTPRIAFPTNVFSHKADLTGNIYRFGFNYRF